MACNSSLLVFKVKFIPPVPLNNDNRGWFFLVYAKNKDEAIALAWQKENHLRNKLHYSGFPYNTFKVETTLISKNEPQVIDAWYWAEPNCFNDNKMMNLMRLNHNANVTNFVNDIPSLFVFLVYIQTELDGYTYLVSAESAKEAIALVLRYDTNIDLARFRVITNNISNKNSEVVWCYE